MSSPITSLSSESLAGLAKGLHQLARMPAEFVEAHIKARGFEPPQNSRGPLLRGRLLKILSDEVLNENGEIADASTPKAEDRGGGRGGRGEVEGVGGKKLNPNDHDLSTSSQTMMAAATPAGGMWEVRWRKVTKVLEYDQNMFEDCRDCECDEAMEASDEAAVKQARGNSKGAHDVLHPTEDGARAAALLRMQALRGQLKKTGGTAVTDGGDEHPAEDSGSFVDFTPFLWEDHQHELGLPRNGLGLHFQRVFWGADPCEADNWNKCEVRVDVWVARRES